MESGPFRVLLVDDLPEIRHLSARALAQEGFTSYQASDGVEALERLRETQFDVVLTDLHMPGMHGHALAVEVLQLKSRPLVVVLTALLEPRMAKDLLARGVDDVMFKPIDFRAMAGKLAGLVKRHRRQLAGAETTTQANPDANHKVLTTA